ncbi:MAG TPA: hypothetical protein DCS19_01350 [Flavobacterium sp.]|nr:hypothetical protein [Flavobacterium sp.]
MTFPTDIQSNTPSKYRFELVGDTKTIVCDTEPLEWASGKIMIKRDLNVGGVFVSSNSDALTFVGNAAEMLRGLYKTSGLNAKCTLITYWWKEFDFENISQGRKYIPFPTRYNIDFNFYQVVKVGGFSFGIKVKAINSSFQTKLDQRQDINVDLTKLTSIGGATIMDYELLRKTINYDATNIYHYAELNTASELDPDLPRVKGTNCYASIPLSIVKNDFNGEIQAVKSMNRVVNITAIPKLLNNSQFDRTFIFKYFVLFTVFERHVGTPPWTLQLIISDELNINFTEIELGTFGNSKGFVSFDSSETIEIKKGESLRLVVKTGNIKSIKAYFIDTNISFTQEVAASPARDVEGMPIYEAFERIGQHIFDTQYPIYSEFFGRDEIKFNDQGNTYTSENQLTFAHIQNGLNLRGLKLSDTPLAINFKDLFKTSNACWNLGYGFETISETNRLRIENYAYFFQDNEIGFSPPLSSRINKYDIESQVMIEFAPNDIKSGFDKYEYLQINGRSEPNTTSQRTLILNTATKFEAIAAYRGDTKGILDSLNIPIDTTDTKQDSDIFITKTQINGINWKPERSENIAIIDGSSVFGEDLLNRYFTPARMLLRQSNRIKSALTKDIFTGSYLTFQTSDKLQTLKTSGTSQSGIDQYTIQENQNIQVSSLHDPIFLPMKHKIRCTFTKKDLEILQSNLYGWIDFGVDVTGEQIKGYLIDFEMMNNEDVAEITIIEKY